MGGCGCDCVGEKGSVWVGQPSLLLRYVCEEGEGRGGGGVCVCGCDCVIVWVWTGVCGWYSLNCCCKVCMCVGGECVCVGVTVWVWV